MLIIPVLSSKITSENQESQPSHHQPARFIPNEEIAMGQIVDIGKRIELVPMDPHFHDITIAYTNKGRMRTRCF